MEYQRRRSASLTPTASICKAVAVGMIVGLLLSLGGFYHRWKLEALKAELLGDTSDQEGAVGEERHKRELAEQLQVEADTERTKLQSQLKELGGAVLEAQEEESKAKREEERAQQALKVAENEKNEAQDQAKAAAKKIADLEAQLVQQLNRPQTGANMSILSVTGIVDRHTSWLPNEERDRADPELAGLLKQIAKNNEVLVAISNRNYAGKGNMLDTWMRNVRRAGVTNAMVVALDEDTRKHAEGEGLASLVMTLQISKTQRGVGTNHAVSGLKFKILQRFLELGYSVLLSDVDVITLQNPFQHLFRDSDVESMSDGWDNATAYGFNDVADDPSMGWARYAHSMRLFCFNSGLFYIRPTQASMDLLKRVMHRIETEAGWDQAIFNEVIFFPSRNEYKDPAVTRRVMDIFKFMNSKVLFKQVRYSQDLKERVPAMVHLNYHANKHERLLAVEQFWVNNDDNALMQFPEGS